MDEKDVEAAIEALRDLCAPHDCPVERIPIDETVVNLPADRLGPAVRTLRETFSLDHLSTITGQDTGEEIELLYHFWRGQGVTLRLRLPYTDLHLPSLTPTIPGALFYEQEITEMLGVTFEGHPDPQPLFLPENWEEGFPLRQGTLEAEDEPAAPQRQQEESP
jgi:NADH:ubiquinone oxidoreductase subunit C